MGSVEWRLSPDSSDRRERERREEREKEREGDTRYERERERERERDWWNTEGRRGRESLREKYACGKISTERGERKVYVHMEI